MATKYFGTPMWGVAIGTVIVIVAAIVLSEPKIAWNTGARERLSSALRAIGSDLASGRINPADFIAQDVPRQADHHDGRRDLAKDYGITLQWHQKHGYEDMLFYPIAISSKIEISINVNVSVAPQVVMVPVEFSDMATLPTLFECIGYPENKLQECQLRAMKKAFSKHNIDYAAALMSDASVVYVRVNDVFGRRADE